MSGSGGGGGGGSGGGGYSPTDSKKNCEDLTFETMLNSPDPSVINQMSIGDILDVEIVATQGVNVVGALRRNTTRDLAGTITDYLRELLRCLQSSNVSYEAEVLSINGGIVRVRVESV